MTIVLNILKAIVRWTWKIWAGFCGIWFAALIVGVGTKLIGLDPPDAHVVWSGSFKTLLKKK